MPEAQMVEPDGEACAVVAVNRDGVAGVVKRSPRPDQPPLSDPLEVHHACPVLELGADPLCHEGQR